MKRKFLATVMCALFAAAASAQMKISGTGKCAKPDSQQAIEVGDRSGHALTVSKTSCTWTVPVEMAGLKSKSYTVVAIGDTTPDKSQFRGHVVVIMENGDKAFLRFQGTSTSKNGEPQVDEGTWSYSGGTGKLKGLKGKGAYKGKTVGDSVEDQIEGEYTLPAAK